MENPKRCRVCKDIKPISEFSKNKSTKDGYQSDCKICCKKYDNEYRQTKKGKTVRHKATLRYQQTDKFKACQKRYIKSESGKTSRRIAMKRFYIRHPNYRKANNAVNHAIRDGKLPLPNTLLCHYCPKPAQQYHHWHGYEPEHWLDVVAVCKKCHHECKRKIA